MDLFALLMKVSLLLSCYFIVLVILVLTTPKKNSSRMIKSKIKKIKFSTHKLSTDVFAGGEISH